MYVMLILVLRDRGYPRVESLRGGVGAGWDPCECVGIGRLCWESWCALNCRGRKSWFLLAILGGFLSIKDRLSGCLSFSSGYAREL